MNNMITEGKWQFRAELYLAFILENLILSKGKTDDGKAEVMFNKNKYYYI